MKAIIGGKRYDTEKAELIASDHSVGMSKSDFRWWEEELYRTPKGSWFLAGEGGALTKYAIQVGSNASGAGEAITPLSEEEVREWLEKSENYDALEKHFSSAIEDA